MKKIVVSTFSNTLDNYGQVLQYLATQILFDKLGMEASVLRKELSYKEKFINLVKLFLIPFRLNKDKSKALNPSEIAQKTFFDEAKKSTEREDVIHPRHFEEFRKKYFRFTYCENMQDQPPEADVYCVGSDQFWGWCGDSQFLNYGKDSIKRISLAASFGSYKPSSQEEWNRMRFLLSRFQLITVREKIGLEICFNAGRNDAIVVPDPTLLIAADDYSEYETDIPLACNSYILLYLLGNPTDIDVSEIYSFAKKECLEVVYVTSQGRKDDYPKTYANVSQWLSYIKGARYVFTNSFHGAAISIIYHKAFMVFPLIWPFESMNNRIETLLEKHGLQDRVFKGDYKRIKDRVSFSVSDDYLMKERIYLKEQLKKVIDE